MSTDIRPELSDKNKYWIERHRYYELKHFCLQYPIWKKAYVSLNSFKTGYIDFQPRSKNRKFSDPVERCAEIRVFCSDRMQMIEKAAQESDLSISRYILIGVTQGVSYDYLKMKYDIPCCKDTYYDRYRKFFWILDKLRM